MFELGTKASGYEDVIVNWWLAVSEPFQTRGVVQKWSGVEVQLRLRPTSHNNINRRPHASATYHLRVKA